jgi:glyoxylase-like metal-dependent hydrolase (beta-lactamase superfamily II)
MSTGGHGLPQAPTEEGVYHIYLMRFGTLDRRVTENFLAGDAHEGPMPIDYGLWIVRNQRRTVLVDTGYGPRAAEQRGRPMEFDPIEGLRRVGIDPDEIEDVVITHLHYDHVGNIDRFARARFHIQDAEVAFATGRCMCDQLLRGVFDVEDIVTLVRHTYAERVRFRDGDDDLLPGLTLHALPGHSAMVQAVRVETPRGAVLLASDASHYYANVLHRKPFVLTLDEAQTLQSYTRAMTLAGGIEYLIPGHDPKVRRLYPAYEVNGIELFALHEPPKPIDLAELARLDDF